MAPELNPGEVASKAGETAGGGLAKARAFLARKVGPMPMWGWIAGAAGAVGLALWLKSRGSSLPGLDALTGADSPALAGGGAGAGSSSGTIGGPPIPANSGSGSGTGAGSGSSGSGSGSGSSSGGASGSSSSPSLGDVLPGIGQQDGTMSGDVAPTSGLPDNSATTVGDLNPAWQGLIGTGGGPNTTGRSSGTQLGPEPPPPTPPPPTPVRHEKGGGVIGTGGGQNTTGRSSGTQLGPPEPPAPPAPAKQGPGAGTNHVNDTTGQTTRHGGTLAE